MAYLEIENIKIAGISASVPRNVSPCQGGICDRRLTFSHTGLDLSFLAAEKLIKDLGWEKKDIDALISITTFPDYIMPNNSCILQHKLGLGNHCYAHDIAVESTGWIYGLSALGSLMRTGNVRKAILVTGIGRVRLENNSDDAWFGHAASATAVEWSDSDKMLFHFNTDVPDSDEPFYINQYGMRKIPDKNKLKYKDYQGIDLYNLESKMNIDNEFKYSLGHMPNSVKGMYSKFCLNNDSVDYIFINENNNLIRERMSNELKFKEKNILSSFELFGNTGASSIPLAIVSHYSADSSMQRNKIMCCASGEYSTASVYVGLENALISNLVEC